MTFPRRAACAALVIGATAALAGCDTPSPPMFGADRTRVSVSGQDFTVRHDRMRAESVRTSPMADPGLRDMLLMSRAAIEAASGCPVRSGTLYGDRVMAEAFLDCPDSPGVTLRPAQIFTPPR